MRQELITAMGPDDPDDGDEGRRQLGLAIAHLHQHNIMPDRYGYKVPSQSGHGAYVVNVEPGLLYCDCADFQERQRPCKHVYAVQALIRRDERLSNPPEPPAPPVAVRMSSRQWRQYNTAQVNEGDLFARLLRDLCDTVEQPPQTIGRPRMLLADMLYGMGLKVYSTLSTRRAMSVMGAAVAAGRMDREPSYSVTIKYFERPDVTPILRELIQRSALPLRDLEVDFAQDSSGFASTAYNRWFDHKWGKAQRLQAAGQVGEAAHHVRRPDEHRDGRGRHARAVGGLALHAGLRSGDGGELPHPQGLGRHGLQQPGEPPRGRRRGRHGLHPVQDRRGRRAEAQRSARPSAPRCPVGADVPPVLAEPGRVQPALPQAVERRDLLPHDEGQVRRQGEGQDGHRDGQRGADEDALPQHLRPHPGDVHAPHHARLRRPSRRGR